MRWAPEHERRRGRPGDQLFILTDMAIRPEKMDEATAEQALQRVA